MSPLFESLLSQLTLSLSDWATVDKGDYQDPFQLEINPVAEYNTQFFPRLCLEETPTVDMTGHDYGRDSDREQSPLNSDEVYARVQAEFAKELESFDWTCQDYELEDDVSDIAEDSEFALSEDESEDEPVDVEEQVAVPRSHSATDSEPQPVSNATASIRDSPEPVPIEEPVSAEIETTPQPPQQPLVQQVDIPVESSPSAPVIPEEPAQPMVESPVTAMETVHEDAPLSVTTVTTPPPAPAPPVARVASTSSKDASPDAPSIKLPPIDALGIRTTPAPEQSTVQPGDITISQDQYLNVRLPSGPPSSGLSVSDVISVPSPHQGSPNLLIRRHRHLPSIDRVNQRLSVDLGGTFAQLGDEDWEQLDSRKIPEAVNGANAAGQTYSRFARGLGSVLGRRPSSRTGGLRTPSMSVRSGLRKSVTTSESETDQDLERSPGGKTRSPLFAARGVENTKRVFGRIKAFPPSKRTGHDPSRLSARSPPTVHSAMPSATPSATHSAAPSATHSQSPSSSPSPVGSIRGVAPVAGLVIPSSPPTLAAPLPITTTAAPPPSSIAATASLVASPSSTSVEIPRLKRGGSLRADPASKRSSIVSAFSPGGKRIVRSGSEFNFFSKPKGRTQMERTVSERNPKAPATAPTTAPGSPGATSDSTLSAASASSVPRIELQPTPPIVWGLELNTEKA